MKKTNSKAVMTYLACIMALFLTACAPATENSPIPNQTLTPEPVLRAATDPSQVPRDTQITEAYQQAVEAYGWFDLTTLPTDASASKESNGMLYFRVEHETIKTYADLKKHLQNLFAEEIVNQLLGQADATIHYVDIEGALYAMPADRGSDITKGEETHSIIKNNDGKIIYRVEVEIIDPDTQKALGKETHDFVYEYFNGRWVFSKFYLVR